MDTERVVFWMQPPPAPIERKVDISRLSAANKRVVAAHFKQHHPELLTLLSDEVSTFLKAEGKAEIKVSEKYLPERFRR